MALMDFIKKQFIDIIEWTEAGDGTLAWRFPMADLRNPERRRRSRCASRRWRCSSTKARSPTCSAPACYKLTTQTLPVLTYLKNWDKLFKSPFKSDVYFFSTRQQIDQRWGTHAAGDDPRQGLRRGAPARLRQLRLPHRRPEAVPHRDLGHARHLHAWPTSTASCAALMLQHISDAVAGSGIAVPRPGGQPGRVRQGAAARPPRRRSPSIGLKLEGVTVQNVSLPEELQKILDQKIGMGMVGNDMGKFMQYQTAQAIPKFAEGAGGGGGGIAGDAMGLGAGVALGQVMAQQPAAGPAGRGGAGGSRRGRGRRASPTK